MANPSHEAKVAALIAFEAQALSARGRGRVERHLARCAVCREALASMRAYEGLVKDVRMAGAPEPDWSKMELALEREARAQAQANAAEAARAREPSATRPWIGAVALAAAALLAFWVTRGADPQQAVLLPPVVAQPEQVLSARAEARASRGVTGEVTAVAVAATGLGAGATVALEPGTPVVEGMELRTEASGRVEARLGEETGIVVPERSSVRVARLRSEQVELVLAGGTVASQVQRRTEHGRYEIQAGAYRVVVRGTRFAVTRQAQDVVVTVDEGVVDVRRGEQLVAVVRAPGIWRSRDGVAGVEVGQVPEPHGLDEVASAWPVLRLPRVRGLAQWRIDGATMPGASELAMRVPEGELELFAIDPRGLEVRHVIQVGREGALIDPNAMAMNTEIREQANVQREGFLREDQIATVVTSRWRYLRAIQQRVEGRRGPEELTVSGRMTVRITIGRTGEVSRADVIDARGLLPQEFQEQVRAEVLEWTFPTPAGGVVTFDLPLRFTHGQ